MTTKTTIIATTVTWVATVAYTAYVYPSLPARMVTNWGLDGRPSGWMSREVGAWFGPAIGLLTFAILMALPWFSPRRAGVEGFRGVYNLAVWYVVLFLAAVQVLVLRANLGDFELTRILFALMGLLFMGIGHLLPKTRRNYWMGIRTAWTLEYQEVWEPTHRLGGKIFVVAGLCTLLAGLLLPDRAAMVVMLAAIAVATIATLVSSYLIYRRLDAAGLLSRTPR